MSDTACKAPTIHNRHDFHAFSARFVVPISDPQPLTKTNVASMKHSSGEQWHMLPQSYLKYKTVHRRIHTWCCNEILRRVLTDVANELRDKGALDDASLRAHDGSVSAYVPDVHRQYAPPENASERSVVADCTSKENLRSVGPTERRRARSADRTIRTKIYASVNPSDRFHLFTFTQ